MATADARLVFVLGKEIHGNRQVLIVESGEEYSADLVGSSTIYTDQTARFPYTV